MVQGIPIPEHIGRYRIDEKVGVWARGSLYRGFDGALSHKALLKTLSPDYASKKADLTRFANEARITARLYHSNVINLFEVGEDEGVPYLVFEWLEGKSLFQLMRSGIDLKVSLSISLQVLRALENIHNRGIIHRAISPHSIFVCTDGCAKVTDFSQASLLEPEEHGDATTLRGDVFAVGCVLYELVTGAPFEREELDSRLGSIPREPTWFRLRAVIERALQKTPDGCYPDAKAMHGDLERAVADLFPPPLKLFSWFRRRAARK